MFEIKDQESFPEREERILHFWRKEHIFQKSLEERKGGELFSFYDGPPFATGLPHYGHLLAGTVKDVIPRYQTMRGKYVPRRFGWDCHGLPIENEIEKTQSLTGASSIEQFGIGKFNEECRSIVLRYTSQWQETVERMGRWVDFNNTYKTMDKNFMESVWWVFGQLYEKGLVYEGFKVMPFSARLGTPLSNFEANLNYRDVDDPSLTVMFSLEEDPEVCFVAWTTTPWTLPSNLALAVHPDLDYALVLDQASGRKLIIGQARLGAYLTDYTLLKVFKGKELHGKRYEPLFPYFANSQRDKAFQVIADPFVSIEEGTGVVHMAPAFGEIDFFVCAKQGIEIVCPVDQNGHFTEEVPDFAGKFVKDADREIIRKLKAEKKVLHHTQIRHRYPFCWRSDTPLIYRAVRTWFIAVEKIKDLLLKVNSEIRWVPDHLKEGRFGKWLENARDWAVSRNRYWGTPIPIWRSGDGELIVISSVQDLQEKVGKEVIDLHRHFIDDLTFVERGKVFKRVPEVFDCWFESGSMPYAQNHFPFENKDKTLAAFPADFIGEGLDQTRGWFYTLTVLSAALFESPAFKNVVVNGIILAEDGTKMSKRLKNYPEPGAVIDRYGADAIRLYLLQSPAVLADDLRFSAKGVEHVIRQVLIPFWNAYVFFATYAKLYRWHPCEVEPKAEIDQWMLSRLYQFIDDVTEGMDAYQLQKAAEPFSGFIDDLTNWYIRRCRGRFWADEESADRNEAFGTLYKVLMELVKVAAPFIPFLSEAIYLELRSKEDPESVHLCLFPTSGSRDQELEKAMADVQRVVGVGHRLRKEHKLKVRQPLSKAFVICADSQRLEALKRKEVLIAEELNVKGVEFQQDETQFVQLVSKPNFRVLGKKVGNKMQRFHEAILKLPFHQLQKLLEGSSISLSVEEETFTLTPEDIVIERSVKEGLVASTELGVTVALETELTQSLILEGIARELVNRINTLRKEKGYAISDRIHLKLQTTPLIQEAFELHRDYICHEVLAKTFSFESCTGDATEINAEEVIIELRRG